MDFFEAQARAKKRTSRLLALFTLAVAGTIVAAYFAVIVLLRFSGADTEQRALYGDYDAQARTLVSWRPRVLAAVSLGTLAVVGLASLYKWRQYSAGGGAVAQSVGG